jgi:flagellin-specific chaperone FliS
MFYFKDSADPVGQVQIVDSVERMLVELKTFWDEQKASRSFWKTGVSLSKVTNFLMYALDGLVNAVNEAVITGPDKKATVLDALDRLYEYTVREALPFWLRPVASPIKSYVIHVLVSNAIDWMVLKYREGSWSSSGVPAEAKEEPKASARKPRRQRRSK